MPGEPEIPKYYAGKKILVTGGTGYMGKMLIWKLLQSCPSLDTIYMIIRAKRGKTPKSRRDEVFSNVMFDEFKTSYPRVLEKVVFISGDVGEEGIGLSQRDRDLLIDQVSIIFHGAAVLKMDADLKLAVNVNTEGTLRILNLAEQMKKLEAFVYISTAYCCCENKTVEEKLYPSKHNPYDVINLVRWLDPELLEIVTPKLIHPLPNTYTYSKRLTESLFPDFLSKVPLIIARPTIVVPSVKEPVPGWVDNMNGPVGLFVAGAKGVLRTTMMSADGKANFVAVDVAVNGIITLPWSNRKENILNEIAVFNVGQTEHDPVTWRELVSCGIRISDRYPFEKVLWYPNVNSFETNLVLFKIKVLFYHWVPAYLIDFIMMLIGQKPFLVHVYTKLFQAEKVLRYFAQREWSFVSDKLLQVRDRMNMADREIYPVSMKSVADVELYMEKILLFSRKYLCNEDPSTIESSKRKMKLLYWLDKFVVVVRYIFLIKLLTQVYYLFSRLIDGYQYKL